MIYQMIKNIHRIGRTGRAGRTGIAITFVNRSELRKNKMVRKSYWTKDGNNENTK